MNQAHDPRFDLPDLTAAQLGALMGLTERAVKNRVTKRQFVCHWNGGTPEHPRSMIFTPKDVEHNRSVRASRPAPSAGVSEAKIRKGMERLRRSQSAAAS